jgi:hypothetical protein
MPQWVPWTLVVGRCLVSFPTPVLGGCQHHSPSEIGLVFQLAWELGDALIGIAPRLGPNSARWPPVAQQTSAVTRYLNPALETR